MSQVQDAAGVFAAGRPARGADAEARKALWGSALGYAMDWKKKADVAKAMATEAFGVAAAERPSATAGQEVVA